MESQKKLNYVFIIGLASVLIFGVYFIQTVWAQDSSAGNSPSKPAATAEGSTPQPAATTLETTNSSGKNTQEKTLPNFNSVILAGLGNLHIRQGRDQGLVIKTDAELLPLVSATVDNNTLRLDFKNAEDHSRAEVNYYLTVKDINNIQSYSSSTVFIEDGIETNNLTLEIKSFGDMIVKIKVNTLVAKIEGAGRIRASGIANLQDIQITGTGEFMGNELSGQKASVLIDGTGVARINVTDALTVRILKEGTVGYCGNPNLSKTISTKGVVQVLDDSFCK